MPTPLTRNQVPPVSTSVYLARQGSTSLPKQADILMLEPGETYRLPPLSEIDIRTGGATWERFLSGTRETTLTGPLIALRPREIASPEKTALELQDPTLPLWMLLLGIFGWIALRLIAEMTGHGGHDVVIALGTFAVWVAIAVLWHRLKISEATSSPGRVIDRKASYRDISFMPPNMA